MTVANYVHLVEPQWNPAVEEQAIARAVRIGQTRPVTIIRYIVKKTFEEVRNDSTNLDETGYSVLILLSEHPQFATKEKHLGKVHLG